MGLFEKFLSKLPGNPSSVAKTMLTKYREWQSLEQKKGHDPKRYDVRRMALRYSILSRYQIIRGMNEQEIEYALLAAGDSLFALVLQVIMKENPLALEPPMENQTIQDLYSFFRKNASEQIEIFDSLNS